jgi:hypothetical protein
LGLLLGSLAAGIRYVTRTKIMGNGFE